MRALLVLLVALFISTPATARLPTDWTRAVAINAQGAYVMGNPNAPTRLTEYISYTCPHCAHFTAEASAPLQSGWVKQGRVSIELRNAIRDPYDLTAALLVRCGGAAHFFANHEAVFASQDAWMKQVTAYEDKRAASPVVQPDALLSNIAQKTGLSAFMAKRGIPLPRQKICLTDKDAIAKVGAMTTDAWETKKIGGTPSFAINGVLVDGAHGWDDLRAALPAPAI